MKKIVESWTVQDLMQQFARIEFPEYQREPNLWSLPEKQRLIDSMVRQFDIASLYFYEYEGGIIDCVDGRQRIGAIMSFLGENPKDRDNNFQLRRWNEIYNDDNWLFHSLDRKTYAEIVDLKKASKDETAKILLDRLMNYPLTIVKLSDSEAPEEFNLQFTRLNVGTIINSGEKLHAMVGELRDRCFNLLGPHRFLEGTRIPHARYARAQVAAQIVAQVFSKSASNEFARTRHFDLQRLFKEHSVLTESQNNLVDKVSNLFDLLALAFEGSGSLRNRAITVSVVVLARTANVTSQEDASTLSEFIEEFVCRLSWQVKKGLNIEQEYRYLSDFQRNITQASAEKSAVAARHELLQEQYQRWLSSHDLRGDPEWIERHPDSNPSTESRS